MSIKPLPIADRPSPLASLAMTLKLLAQNRWLLGGLVASVSDYKLVLEDLELATADNVVVGLRSVWARRVATPIIQAQRAMERNQDPQANARLALEILRQCTDANVREVCSEWLREKYDVR